MPTTASHTELRTEFDEIATLTPVALIDYGSEKWLLNNLPPQRGAALDIGCGVGDVARRLANHFSAVDAIDLSPGMIATARSRTAPQATIRFECADLFDWLRAHRATYDCIVTVATLHHVDLETALAEMAAALKPGGRLLIVDLYHRPGLRNLPVNVLATTFGAILETIALLRRQTSLQLRLSYRRHMRNETYCTLHEVETAARKSLPSPQAVVSGTLFWRYHLLWDKPS